MVNQLNQVLYNINLDVELIKNNAMVAALISCKIEELNKTGIGKYEDARVVLCGGFSVDVIARPKQFIQDNSNIGGVHVIPGGCIRNVLECLWKLGVKDCLPLSSVGDDVFGKLLKDWAETNSVPLKGIHTSGDYNTARYSCLMQGGLATGVADMDILANIPLSHFKKFTKNIQNAKFLIMDSNLSIETIEWLCDIAKNSIIAFDPISEEKSKKLLERDLLSKISILKGNIKQLQAIASKMASSTNNPEELIQAIFKHCNKDSKLKYIIATKENEVVCGYLEGGAIKVIKKEEVKVENADIVKTGGAGDAFMGGFIYGMLEGLAIERCIEIGMKCASLSIVSVFNINPGLSISSIQ